MSSNHAASEAARAYRQRDIETADPLGLVVRVLELASQHLARARTALAAGNAAAKGGHIDRVCRAIALLQGSLDMEQAPVADNLDRLYHYMQLRLTAGHLHNDDTALAEVGGHLAELASAWRQAAEQPSTPATAPPAAVAAR